MRRYYDSILWRQWKSSCSFGVSVYASWYGKHRPSLTKAASSPWPSTTSSSFRSSSTFPCNNLTMWTGRRFLINRSSYSFIFIRLARRLFLQSPANPDLMYIIMFSHTQLTTTLLLVLIFGSKVSTVNDHVWLDSSCRMFIGPLLIYEKAVR